jgi:hypothetical protein
MADLRISELPALAGANLASGDLLPIVDVSASETKKITIQDAIGFGVTLIADATIPNAKIVFNSASIPGSALAAGGVGTTQLADDAVTAAKLGNESTVDLVTTLPASGAFTGQLALDTGDLKVYCWNGAAWQSIKAAGSINTVNGSTTGVINIVSSTSGDTVTVSATLDNTSNPAEFLAGPTAAAGAAGYRTIVGDDLPTASSGSKGAVTVNGEGLRLDATQLEINNDVTASGATYSVVNYDAKGLITAGRAITGSDIPAATASTKGAIIPGTGLAVDGSGNLNHSNTVTTGTYTKVTVDAQGHVSTGATLSDTDIPNHSAATITSGTLDAARIASNSITGARLANYAVSKFGETQPVADHIGQFFFNPLNRELYLWDGNVYQPVGISAGQIVLAGTYNASSNLLDSVTADGTAAGFVNGQALPAAAAVNNRYYVVVSTSGTGTSPAPTVALDPPDLLLSNGSTYIKLDVSDTITAVVATNVGFTPYGNIASNNVQAAIQELDDEKLAANGGTVTGQLLIGDAGSLVFEGSTANDYETTLAVTDPTADRTITFPDVSGAVVTTGDTGTVTSTMIADGTVVNADINASAAIAYSKLASLTAGNIVLGNASNIATSTAVTGDVTINSSGVTAISSGVIVNADINASAAISGSKIQGATTSNTGAVQLTDSTSSTSTSTAATPNSVKSAYDLAAAALPKSGGTMTGAITFAAGQTISGYGLLDGAQTWTKGQRGEITALTDGATITPDFADSNNFSVTLGGNRTLANPTNLTAGQSGCIWITQDGTGSRTLGYDSYWDFTGGTPPILSTAASAVDCLVYAVQSSTKITATLISNLS